MSGDQPIGIGSEVWRFETNRRVYGRTGSAPIWREHWLKVYVVGETRRSWIVTYAKDSSPDSRNAMRAPKSRDETARRQWAYSEAEVDASCWDNDNRYLVVRAVQSCSPETLRQVAAVVGYTEKAKVKA